jgi:hypothetical protein
MGLNPNHCRVLHQSAADEEQRFKQFGEKRLSISQTEDVQKS